jgi:hypothetical protein
LVWSAWHLGWQHSYDVPVDGIQCGIMMNGFHVHAHLDLFDSGHQVFLYGGIGRSQRSQLAHPFQNLKSNNFGGL